MLELRKEQSICANIVPAGVARLKSNSATTGPRPARVAHDAHEVEHCPGEAVDAGADQAAGVAVGEPVQRCDQGG